MMLSFEWLPEFILNYIAMLSGITVYSGVSLLSVIVSVGLLVVMIRGIVLKR